MQDTNPGSAKFNEDSLLVVQDQLQECPYLPDAVARMPLLWPQRLYDGETVDELFALGFRRSGAFVYRTHCPHCSACKPTRISVADFQLRASQRRVLKRGDRALTVRMGEPQTDEARVKLFNLHRNQRGLSKATDEVDLFGYQSFLVDTFCETAELSVWDGKRLVAVAVTDLGRRSASAVYTYFDPDYARYSLGTYAIVKQWEWCRQTERDYLYLGLYVAENRHLNYKANYRPQERLLDGRWQVIGNGSSAPH